MNDTVRTSLITCAGNTEFSTRELIVGSGVGGSLCADWYSRQREGVLVLEEGPDSSELPSPPTLLGCMRGMWREGGIVPIESNARFVFAEGRTVGGGSMVNAGILHRLPPEIATDWQTRYHLANYGTEVLEPFFSQAEAVCAIPPSPTPSPSLQAQFFCDGAKAQSWETVSPLTTIGTQPNGFISRQSMRATYLARACTQGTQILTRCRAQRIIIQQNRAVGVIAEHEHPDGTKHLITIHCERLTLACGALQTPLLLQRSGITRRIGQTLRFHPTLRITASFPTVVRPWNDLMSAIQIKALAPELSFGMSLSWPAHLAASLTPQWPYSRPLLDQLEHLAMYYVATPSHGTGHIRPFGPSSYRVTYPLGAQDLFWLEKGYRHLARLLTSAGAIHLAGSLRGKTNIEQPFKAKDLFAMSIHAFSSCPMGETDMCPVDSYGKLKGFTNITIQDASLLPEAPTVNPQLTVMATVLRNLTLGS